MPSLKPTVSAGRLALSQVKQELRTMARSQGFGSPLKRSKKRYARNIASCATSSASWLLCVSQRARLYAAPRWGSTTCSKLPWLIIGGSEMNANRVAPHSVIRRGRGAMDERSFLAGTRVPTQTQQNQRPLGMHPHPSHWSRGRPWATIAQTMQVADEGGKGFEHLASLRLLCNDPVTPPGGYGLASSRSTFVPAS